MVNGAVVPDGEIIDVLPAVADLKVVVLDNELGEPVEEVLGFSLAEAVDLSNVVANSEDTLPAGDRVGADDGVDGLKELADVLGGTTLSTVNLKAVAVSSLVEAGLGICGGQGVKEALDGLGDAVVDLVARSPERICSSHVSST